MRKFIGLAFVFIAINCHAGLISHTDYTDGAVITAAGQNSNENAIFNEFNGNIDNNNIKASGVATANIANGAVTSAKLDSTLAITSATVTNLNVSVPGFGIGKILQVKCSSETTGGTTTSSTFLVVGTTVTITLSSTTSRVILWGGGLFNDSTSTDGHAPALGFAKNGVALFARNNSPFQYITGGFSSAASISITGFWLDSPASTSQLSYALMFASGAGSSVNFGGAAATGSTSQICALEVGP